MMTFKNITGVIDAVVIYNKLKDIAVMIIK